MTVFSWLNFGRSCAPGKGVCGQAETFGSTLLQPARSVCVSERLFHLYWHVSNILKFKININLLLQTVEKEMWISLRTHTRPLVWRHNTINPGQWLWLSLVFANPDIRYPDIRIYPLILWQPKTRISWSENPAVSAVCKNCVNCASGIVAVL